MRWRLCLAAPKYETAYTILNSRDRLPTYRDMQPT